MRATFVSLVAASAFAWACGSSYPPPTQPMADAQAADRSARELGAANSPKASLHLKLAKDQMREAVGLMKDGENERAEQLLVRAKADAELAVALAHEQKAKSEVQDVAQKAQQQQQNLNPGAGK